MAGRKELSRLSELKMWREDMGVKYALFDMDGTLVDTWTHYRVRMGEYCRFLSEASGDRGEDKLFSEDELLDVFLEGIVSLRDEFQVHPAVLDVPARVLAKMCGAGGSELERQMDELMMIYELSPEVFPEAVEQVRLVRDAGVDPFILTHAGEGWTLKKKRKFFGLFKGYACTPVYRPKDALAWRGSIEELQVDPRRAMAIGDSWTSDIEPALANGIKIVVWVRNGAAPKNDDRVIEIETIAGLVDALLLVR